MALTVETLKTDSLGRNFPDILTDADYTQIAEAALRDFNYYNPIHKFAAFLTEANIQDYYIFDPENSVTSGFAQNAMQIIDVWWNPGGDWSSLNIYSPGWAILANIMLFTGNYFHTPSLMMILRQKLEQFRKQFGNQGFDLYGMFGDSSAFLRIYPVPSESNCRVIVEYTEAWTLSAVTPPVKRSFYQWMDYHVSLAIANKYSVTAGLNVLGFTDSQQAMRFWRDMAKQYYDIALETQGGMSGQVGRS